MRLTPLKFFQCISAQAPILCSLFLAVSSFGADAITNIMSPIVSYQYPNDFSSEALTNGGISSPIISYQYFEWPGDDILRLVNSPQVSYYYESGLAGVSGAVVAIYPTASYAPASGALTMTAVAIDPLYGVVTNGTLEWTLEMAGLGPISTGTGTYSGVSGRWEATSVYGFGLTPGNFTVVYNITTGRGRQGTASLAFTVGGSGVVVNGVITDASSQTPLSGAQVALFTAGGTGGFWTLVNSLYGGVVPDLATLLSQVTPVMSPITTGADGAFSWAGVPAGNSYVLVVSKSGYQQQYSSSFNVTAASATITRNFQLSTTGQTLAALSGDVAAVATASGAILINNAGLVGATSTQWYKDNIYSIDFDWVSFSGDIVGALAGGVEDLPNGVTALTEKGLEDISLSAVKDFLREEAPFLIGSGIDGWAAANRWPANQLAYLASAVHANYLSALDQTNLDFQASASGYPLPVVFSKSRVDELTEQVVEQAGDVINGLSRYVASPEANNGFYGFTLRDMTQSYLHYSALYQAGGTFDEVLTGVQIVGGVSSLLEPYLPGQVLEPS